MAEPRRRSKPPGNIAPLATLPVFFKLRGRRVLVAGGTPSAVWKAELLAAAGARVRVVASEPCAEMVDLADASAGGLTLERRAWAVSDLDGAAIAVGAFEGQEGEAFREAAQASGVPVNVIDVPALCDFQFGTIVARSPLVIGISTDGAAPVFGQALRARIELGFAARRRFWETFADRALEGAGRLPTEEDRQACLEAATTAAREGAGRLILVGVGPGAPDLVTLQAVRALQSADVILHEASLALGVLGLGRREARRIASPVDPEATANVVRTLLREGQTIAWVGPGDAATCPVWSSRAARLSEPETQVDIVRGLRCDTCPHGCAARPSDISAQ
jgi:uroporphyrin-III C-methyltransferase/precorrin-2 dehydrogenase/sirohydrochlorin ferrochelatase